MKSPIEYLFHMEVQGTIDDVRVQLAIVDGKWLVLSNLLSGREISRSMINHPLSIEGTRLKWADRYIQLDSTQLESAFRLMEVASGNGPNTRPSSSSSFSPPAPLNTDADAKLSRKQIAIALVVLVGLVAGVFLLSQRGDNSKVTVEYSLEVNTTDFCRDLVGDLGYGDIPFAEVEVIDGDGRLLGTSNLDGGLDTDSSCIFSATFEVRKSSDGNYRITAGNNNRGYLTWTSDDISSGRLVASASLGD